MGTSMNRSNQALFLILGLGLVAALPARAGGQDTANTPHSATVSAEGGSVFYEALGEGPVVVFIHGGNMDRSMWDPQFRRFSSQYRVIRFDVRGAGESPASGPFFPADDVLAVLDDAGVAEAHIVGLSNGGGIAIDFALEYPERTTSLVLAEPAVRGFQFGPAVQDVMQGVISALRSRDYPAALKLLLASEPFDEARKKPEVFAKITELVTDNLASFAMFPNYRFHDDNAWDRLGELTPPTIFMVSEFASEDAREIEAHALQQIHGITRVEIDSSGHMMNLENPDGFNAALARFLAAH